MAQEYYSFMLNRFFETLVILLIANIYPKFPWIVQSPIISGSTLGKFHANLIQVQYMAWQIF